MRNDFWKRRDATAPTLRVASSLLVARVADLPLAPGIDTARGTSNARVRKGGARTVPPAVAMAMTRPSLVAQNTVAQPHRVGRAPRRPALAAARATARVVDRRGRTIALPLGARSFSRDVAVRASRDASRERLPTAEASPAPEDAAARVTAPSQSAWAPWLAKFPRVVALAVVAAAVSALVFPDTALAAAKKTAAAVSSSADASWFKHALEWVVHLDAHLVTLFSTYGALAYGVLFAIIFCETGLVVTPFLPGDSLLFATGALGAAGVLSFKFTLALLFVAAVLGDTVNYSIGSWIGGRVIEKYPTVFQKSYIEKTKVFYEEYGGKTIVLARFFVIVRTFAPFVAGVAKMNYKKFLGYNFIGAAVWVMSFMFLGYFFGQIPAVQENFATTIAGVILLSLVPMVIEVVQHARGKSGEGEASGDEEEGEDLAVPANS